MPTSKTKGFKGMLRSTLSEEAPLPEASPVVDTSREEPPVLPASKPLREKKKKAPRPAPVPLVGRDEAEELRMNKTFFIKRKYINWLEDKQFEYRYKYLNDFFEHILDTFIELDKKKKLPQLEQMAGVSPDPNKLK